MCASYMSICIISPPLVLLYAVEKGILTAEESTLLAEAIVGTRALVVLGWMSRLFEQAEQLGYGNFILINNVVSAISGAGGGGGAPGGG